MQSTAEGGYNLLRKKKLPKPSEKKKETAAVSGTTRPGEDARVKGFPDLIAPAAVKFNTDHIL